MTAEAILFVVGCDLLIGCIGFEKCPAPSFTPQRVIREPILGVLDHHEPDAGVRSPMRITCRKFGVIGHECFFNEYGSIGELAIFSIILSRTRRSVGNVHFSVAVGTGGSIRTEKLISVSNVSWLANVAFLIDQIEAVESTLTLRMHILALRMQRGVRGQDRKRKDY